MENRRFQILLVGGQFTNTYKIIRESVSFDPVPHFGNDQSGTVSM